MAQADSGMKALRRANKIIVFMQKKLGLAIGPMQVLGVRGRKTGVLRETPVAVITLNSQRYVFQAYPKASWVVNARAAETAALRRGRRAETVKLIELPTAERVEILHHLVNSDPRVSKAFVKNGMAESTDPAAISAAAPGIGVFRIEPS
jgi:hypothetical protein